VRQVNSALEFLAQFDPETPGCALVDLQMPEMNELHLQAALTRTRKAMPVIFLIGHGDAQKP
jgi:FixJ family two-component response regulator